MNLIDRGLDLLDEWLGFDEEDEDDGCSGEPVCLYCPCRPHMSYCGKLFPTDSVVQEGDGCGCPDCEDCVKAGRCQSCGCNRDEECSVCEDL